MSVFAKRLRALREKSGQSQQKLADLLGISKSSINMYERGEREPGLETVQAIARHFQVPTDYLFDTQSPSSTRRIPVLGAIACGQPIFAEETYEEYWEADSRLDADFCLYAKGDSMVGARIYDGDLVFIRRQDTVDNGDIAAVIIEDSATLKRVYYYPKEGTLSLHAENPLYPPLVYTKDQLNQIHILGKAIAFQSRIL